MTFASQPCSPAVQAQQTDGPLTRKVLGAGWLALILCASCATQAPTTTPWFENASALATLTPSLTLETYRTASGVAAFWTVPDTNNVWIPEWSNNLIDWQPSQEGAYMLPRSQRDGKTVCTNCPHFTDTTIESTDFWFVRLRRK